MYKRQELTLSSEDEGTIYYTLDGSEATTDSTEYKEPIQLNQEGETTVRAIFVNKKGIASVEVQKTYTIQFQMCIRDRALKMLTILLRIWNRHLRSFNAYFKKHLRILSRKCGGVFYGKSGKTGKRNRTRCV